jgi:hypothetical protein
MPARSRIARPLAVALSVASVAIAAPARAQDAVATAATATPTQDSVPAPTVPAETRLSAGPTVEAAAVGVRHAPSEASESAQRRSGGYGQPMALMVVGGAALLAGLIIGGGGGTAIAVGGALVGLYGLYQYLQ